MKIIDKYKQTIQYYKNENDNLQQENKQLKEKIDKALKFIKEHNVIGVNKEYLPQGMEYCCSQELLEILKGDSNE